MSTHWTNRDGVAIAWSDLDDRHLWNIVRILVRRVRGDWSLHNASADVQNSWLNTLRKHRGRVLLRSRTDLRNARRQLRKALRTRIRGDRSSISIAIDEVTRRGLLPTVDDLRVAWDRACGGTGGPNVADDPKKRPWCLVELWVGFRGVPTFTPEWLAKQRHMIKRSASVAP